MDPKKPDRFNDDCFEGATIEPAPEDDESKEDDADD